MKTKKYEMLTKYLEFFKIRNDYGNWVFNNVNQRTNDDLIQVPYVQYNEKIYDFIEAFYHSELVDQDYISHLRQNNYTTFNISEIKNLSGDELLTLLTLIIRGERFCEGLLDAKIRNGTIEAILSALLAFDN